jgi:hypothetical protein
METSPTCSQQHASQNMKSTQSDVRWPLPRNPSHCLHSNCNVIIFWCTVLLSSLCRVDKSVWGWTALPGSYKTCHRLVGRVMRWALVTGISQRPIYLTALVELGDTPCCMHRAVRLQEVHTVHNIAAAGNTHLTVHGSTIRQKLCQTHAALYSTVARQAVSACFCMPCMHA